MAPVARRARRAIGHPEADVVDVVAELFAQAWRSRSRFRDPGDGSAAAWLYGICRHIAAHHHRSGRVQDAARRRLGLTPDGAGAASGGPEDRIGDHRELEDALAALPPAQATAVRLRVVDELDYAAIGARLSCTPVTARKHVSLGLRRLRRTLEQDRRPYDDARA